VVGACVGNGDGAGEGSLVGWKCSVGAGVGLGVGSRVGRYDGTGDGFGDGGLVGKPVGSYELDGTGVAEGAGLGTLVGCAVGTGMGACEGMLVACAAPKSADSVSTLGARIGERLTRASEAKYLPNLVLKEPGDAAAEERAKERERMSSRAQLVLSLVQNGWRAIAKNPRHACTKQLSKVDR